MIRISETIDKEKLTTKINEKCKDIRSDNENK
jgi:hypothetical protein